MSSVVILGDSSGSITLQAPAVSGNTTLNLPAVNGTLSIGGVGEGQTWQNLTASRALSTNYTNSTGKPIMVSVWCFTSGSVGNVNILVDGISVAFGADYGFGGCTVIVPNGSVYRAQSAQGLNGWAELR